MTDDENPNALTNMLQDARTDAGAAMIAGMHLAEAKPIEIRGVPHVIIPLGSAITKLDALMDTPKRLAAEATFNEPDSFCKYVSEYKDSGTPRIYAAYPDAIVTSILDDHQPGKPSWCDHKATLKVERSPELVEWTEASSDAMHQQALSDFFETHIRQIAKPDAADIISGVRSLTVSSNSKVVSVRREGGDLQVEVGTEINAAAKTSTGKLPLRLTLALRPFRFWDKIYPLEILLSYTLQGSNIFFRIKFIELEDMLEQAFGDIRNYIENETGLRVLL